jgi:ABC-type branched-subunit amino acid transport system substrate-binding protein
MRHSLFITFVGCLSTLTAGCAAIHGLDEYTTAGTPATEAATATEGANPPPKAPSEGGTAPTGCRSNSDCLELGTQASNTAAKPPVSSAICVEATGTCVSLVNEDCPRLYGDATSDDAVVIGTLLSETTPSALEQAAFLAVKEIDANGGGLPPAKPGEAPRPLVVLGCNVGGDARRATRHLAEELRVPAVIGPTSGELVVELTQQITARSGTLLMSPTSVVSSISNLADGELTWRATPSDAQRAKLVIEQIRDLETLLRATRSLTTVKLAIVHPTDALGLSARDAISGKLILNGRFLDDAANAANVSVDAYAAGNAGAQAAIATKYAATFRPDIVFLTAAEQLATVLVPLEQALTAARAVARPYYVVTDAAKTQALLDTVSSSSVPVDIRRRIRGVGVKPDASSLPVLEDFRAAFTARYGAPAPEPAGPLTYDATYAVAYAIAATPSMPPVGASVAHGLRMLSVGSPAAVGSKGLGAVRGELSAGRSVALRGTFGLMQWDASGDITGGTVEVWCLGGAVGSAPFGSSGLTMDVQTQVVGGAFVQCQ